MEVSWRGLLTAAHGMLFGVFSQMAICANLAQFRSFRILCTGTRRTSIGYLHRYSSHVIGIR